MARWVQGPARREEYIERAKKRLLAIAFAIEGDAKRVQTDFPYVDTGRSRASISTNWTDSGLGRAEVGTFSTRRKDGGRQEYQLDKDGIGNPGLGKNGEFVVVVGSNVEYFPYLELGTQKLAPAAMLRRAFEKYRSSLERLGSVT